MGVQNTAGNLPQVTEDKFVSAIEGPVFHTSGKQTACRTRLNSFGWTFCSSGVLYFNISVLRLSCPHPFLAFSLWSVSANSPRVILQSRGVWLSSITSSSKCTFCVMIPITSGFQMGFCHKGFQNSSSIFLHLLMVSFVLGSGYSIFPKTDLGQAFIFFQSFIIVSFFFFF